MQALPVTPRTIALRAADIIRTGGWCRGQLSLDSARCIVGAISDATIEAVSTQDEYEEMGFAVIAAAETTLGLNREDAKRGGVPNLVHWNDAPERTAGEVIALLERCAGVRS